MRDISYGVIIKRCYVNVEYLLYITDGAHKVENINGNNGDNIGE